MFIDIGWIIAIGVFLIGAGYFWGAFAAGKMLSMKLFHFLQKCGSSSVDAFDFLKDFEKYVNEDKKKRYERTEGL